MRTSVTLPLLGAAVLTVGALLVQVSRKPEARATDRLQDRVAAKVEPPLLDRLRERGF